VLASEVRFLFGYDRWATRRLLNAAQDLDAAAWSRPATADARGIGGALVHALGAHQRRRNGWQGRDDRPRPELEALPSVEDLRDRWEIEWAALDDWFDTLTDADVNRAFNGTPLWQAMVQIFNHGTQHRSEAAVLLTEAGHSPGDLDFSDYVEERANRD